MIRRRYRTGVVAFGMVSLLAGSAWADGPVTTRPAGADESMAEQVRRLQEKVDRLERAQAASRPAAEPRAAGPVSPPAPAAAPRAGTYDPLIGQRRGDADPINSFRPGPEPTPATSLDGTSPITGGWNGSQFVLRSVDGNFTFHPGLTVDIRNLTTYREHVPAGGGGSEVKSGGYDTDNGFDVTRLRLLFDGTLFHQVSYLLQFSADQGQSLTLLDAAASYRFGDSPFQLKAGQFKDPVWHERNFSEAYLMAVDRSLVEQFLAGGQGSRVQGAAFTFDGGPTRAQLVAHDGFNSQNTKFFESGGVPGGLGGAAGVAPTDFGFSTRAEYMLIGTRTKTFNPYLEYDQFTSLGARQSILVVGGGADYSQAGANDVILHSADAQYNNPNGFSAYAAYYGTYRKVKTNQGVQPDGSFYTWGYEAQAAYLVGKFEPFARYDYVHFDPDATRQVNGLNSRVLQEITVGANYYVYGQKLKLTADASYLPDGSPGDVDAAGVLKNSGNNEFVFRAQVQLAM